VVVVNLGTMSFAGKKGVEKAFAMLRTLPRICLANIRRNPGTRIRVNNTYKPESRISVMFNVPEDKIESVHITVLVLHVERET
jgi:hypothetical protein